MCGTTVDAKNLSPLCYPRVPSGEPTRRAKLCMSPGPAQGGAPVVVCQSSSRTPCDDDRQCRSQRCLRAECSQAGACM
ncbi:MAG: hypothetical protein EXR72_26475 [Myxococcales bacterium]|nr:hypothetical protein [Myxococcales bacterium]